MVQNKENHCIRENSIILKYKIQVDEEIDLNKNGSVFSFENYVLKQLYLENLGVAASKISDLKSLCDPIRGIIPAENHWFYESLKAR